MLEKFLWHINFFDLTFSFILDPVILSFTTVFSTAFFCCFFAKIEN